MAAAPRSLDRFAVVAMLVLCSSWGMNQIATKVAFVDFGPITQSALRSTIGSVLVAAYAWRVKPKIFDKDGTWAAGLVIGLAFAFEFVTLFFAVKQTTVTNAIVFFYTAPFFVALGSILLLPNERLRPRQWLGMGLAFVGVAAGFHHSTEGATLSGDCLAVVAGAGWAATTLLAKATRLSAVDPLKTLLYQTVVSAVVCAALAVAIGEPWPAHMSALPVASVLYQAVWVTALTYPVWFWLLTVYRAAELSAFTFLAPVLGVAAGWLLLGEALTPSFLVAMTLVALGILLVNWPASGFRLPAGARAARRDPV